MSNPPSVRWRIFTPVPVTMSCAASCSAAASWFFDENTSFALSEYCAIGVYDAAEVFSCATVSRAVVTAVSNSAP